MLLLSEHAQGLQSLLQDDCAGAGAMNELRSEKPLKEAFQSSSAGGRPSGYVPSPCPSVRRSPALSKDRARWRRSDWYHRGQGAAVFCEEGSSMKAFPQLGLEFHNCKELDFILQQLRGPGDFLTPTQAKLPSQMCRRREVGRFRE